MALLASLLPEKSYRKELIHNHWSRQKVDKLRQESFIRFSPVAVLTFLFSKTLKYCIYSSTRVTYEGT